jgi:hypothetical protein
MIHVAACLSSLITTNRMLHALLCASHRNQNSILHIGMDLRRKTKERQSASDVELEACASPTHSLQGAIMPPTDEFCCDPGT